MTYAGLDGDNDLDILVINTARGTPPSGVRTQLYFLLNDEAGYIVRNDDVLRPDDEAGEFGNKYTSRLLFDADGDGDFNFFLGSHGDGDCIRLSAVDADTTLGGDQAFAFIGGAAFSNVAGQLRYEQIAGNSYIMGDTNGDGTADFWIRLDGLHTLAGSDFIL